MSVNVFSRDKIGTADELEIIATKGRNRTYVGTRQAVDDAIARGDIGNGSMVYITDDYKPKTQEIAVPVGTILPFAGKTLPGGYLYCDGAVFDTSMYPDLMTVLNDNHTPDLTGRFLMGKTSSNPVGTKVSEQLPNIKGDFVPWAYNPAISPHGAFSASGSTENSYAVEGQKNGARVHFNANKTLAPNGTTIDNPAYKDPVNGVPVKVRPDSYVVAYIIKAL